MAPCPQGVLRSLLGWKLMGTSLLRNWISSINPLQMSVEVHCQSQLVAEILLSHVLATPGWSCCSVFTLGGGFSAEREVQSWHQSRERQRGPSSCSAIPSPPQQVNLSLFPPHALCKDSLKAPWAVPSWALFCLGCSGGCQSILPGPGAPVPCLTCCACAGSPAAACGGTWAGQRPQHPWCG